MTKAANKLINWPGYAVNLSIALSGGAIIGGLQGGATALSITITDEFLINRDFTTKHYLTTTALWTSIIILAGELVITAFPEYIISLYGLALTFAIGIAYFGHDPLNYRHNIEEIAGHLLPVIQLFDDRNIISTEELSRLQDIFKHNPYKAIKMVAKDLYYLSSNKLLVTMGAINSLVLVDTLLSHTLIQYIGNTGTNILMITLSAHKLQEGLYDLTSQAYKISLLLCAHNIAQALLSFGKNSLEDSLTHSIQQKTIEKILLNPLQMPKLLQVSNISEVTQNLHNDFNNLFIIGNFKLAFITTGKIKEFIAFHSLLEVAPGILLIGHITVLLNKKMTDKAQQKLNELAKLSKEIELENFKIVADLSKNFANAILTEADDFIQNKYLNNITKKIDIATKVKLSQQIQVIALNVVDVWQKFTQVIYYGYKITTGTITIEYVPIISTWLNNVSPLLQGGTNTVWAQGNIAKKRVKQILEVISSPQVTDIRCEFNVENKIIIKNYSLQLQDEVILKIDYLEFLGKHCAIKGASGVGKSSLLKDLQNCLSSPLQSSGSFSLPLISENISINSMFIDQNLYIPATATLFEAMTMMIEKNKLEIKKAALKSKIIKLFKQLAIDMFAAQGREDLGLISELDNQGFNTDNLSGGQKKKIGIIKALITKPKILFADEIFVGLDVTSLYKAQCLLNKYLPDTKIIIVDHYAANNNYKGFYDYCIE